MTCEHNFEYCGTISTPKYCASIMKCSKCQKIIEDDKVDTKYLKLYGLRLRNQEMFARMGVTSVMECNS